MESLAPHRLRPAKHAMNTRRHRGQFTASVLAALAVVLALHSIALAQLAGGPWPMFHHDLRHTGQSTLLGPYFPAGAPGPQDVQVWHGLDKIRSSPTLSADGATIYVALGWQLCAIDADTMAQNWCFKLRADVSDSSPAVGADGTIYLGDRDNTLSAFNPNGTLKWRYNNGFEGDIWTSPAIGADGTIYFANDQSKDGAGVVTALYPDGTVKWKYVTGTPIRQSSPAIDKNGIIYMGDLKGVLHAFQDKGPNNVVRLWKVQVGLPPSLTAAPVISAGSKVLYIGSDKGLTALDITSNPNPPAVLWTLKTNGMVDQTPALAADGTLYAGAMLGSAKTLYAVNPDGSVRWQYGPVMNGSSKSVHAIVGADGVIYAGMGNGVNAFSPAGNLIWSFQTTNAIISFPCIGGTATAANGGLAVLYLPSQDHNLYAISHTRGSIVGNAPPTAQAGPDQSSSVGQILTFDGSQGGDSGGDALSYLWDFGDGHHAVTPIASHAYWAAGTYTATLTVSDGFATAVDTAKVSVSPLSGGPITFTDDFTRPDGTSLGNGWAEVQGDLTISSAQVTNAAMKGTHMAIQPAVIGTAQAVAADFTSVDNDSKPRFGVMLRFQDSQNYYLAYRFASTGTSSSSNGVGLSKIVNGIETALGKVQFPQPILNAPFHLAATANGATLGVSVDGQELLSRTDSTFSVGAVGVMLDTGKGKSHYSIDNFSATGIGPEITVSPRSLSFGGVAVGSVSTQAITVRNIGTQNLVLGAVALGGANPEQFKKPVARDLCSGQTLAPAATCTMKIKFKPKNTGPQSAIVVIPSNALNESSVAVALGGTGL